MVNLVITVISIALFAAMTALSIAYIPADAFQKQQILSEVTKGVQSMDGTVTRYLKANRDINGVIIYPGNGVDLKAAMTPAYGFLPSDVKGSLAWEVRADTANGLASVGVCVHPLTGQGTPNQQEALAGVKRQLPVGSTFVSTSCNAGADVAGGGYLTYWVALAHVN